MRAEIASAIIGHGTLTNFRSPKQSQKIPNQFPTPRLEFQFNTRRKATPSITTDCGVDAKSKMPPFFPPPHTYVDPVDIEIPEHSIKIKPSDLR